MDLEIVPFYAGFLGLYSLFLSHYVIRLRWKTKTGLGTGESLELLKSVRMHANFSESVPLTLILCSFLEINKYPATLLHCMGIVLFLGRILHSIGLKKSANFSLYRFIGTSLTHLVLLGASLACLPIWPD